MSWSPAVPAAQASAKSSKSGGELPFAPCGSLSEFPGCRASPGPNSAVICDGVVAEVEHATFVGIPSMIVIRPTLECLLCSRRRFSGVDCVTRRCGVPVTAKVIITLTLCACAGGASNTSVRSREKSDLFFINPPKSALRPPIPSPPHRPATPVGIPLVTSDRSQQSVSPGRDRTEEASETQGLKGRKPKIRRSLPNTR
jgi:hypothetical protein